MDNKELIQAQLTLQLGRKAMASLLGVTPTALDHYRAGRRKVPGSAEQLLKTLHLLRPRERASIIKKLNCA